MEGRIAVGPDSCNLNRRDLSVLGGRPHTTPWIGSTRFAPRQACDVSHAVTFRCHEYGLSNVRVAVAFRDHLPSKSAGEWAPEQGVPETISVSVV
jgi:hypothetical protein